MPMLNARLASPEETAQYDRAKRAVTDQLLPLIASGEIPPVLAMGALLEVVGELIYAGVPANHVDTVFDGMADIVRKHYDAVKDGAH